jgi:protein SDA1
MESDSSEDSSESEGWIDVESEGEDIDISDSEDEDNEVKEKDGSKEANTAESEARISTLATTKVGYHINRRQDGS